MKKKTKSKLIRFPIFLLLGSFVFLIISFFTLRQRISFSSQAKNRNQNVPTLQLRPDLCDPKNDHVNLGDDTYQYVGYYGYDNCYLFQVSYKNKRIVINSEINDQTESMAWNRGPGYEEVATDDRIISSIFKYLIPNNSYNLWQYLQNKIFPKIIHVGSVTSLHQICAYFSPPDIIPGGCFVNNYIILPIYSYDGFDSNITLTPVHEIFHAISYKYSEKITNYYLKDTDQCVVFDPNSRFSFSYYSNDNDGNIRKIGLYYASEFLPTLGEVIYYIRQYGPIKDISELNFFTYFSLLPLDKKNKYLELALDLEKKLMNNDSNFSIFEPINYRSSQLGKTLFFLGNNDDTVGFNLIKDFSDSLKSLDNPSNLPVPPWPTVAVDSVKEICETGYNYDRYEPRKAK